MTLSGMQRSLLRLGKEIDLTILLSLLHVLTYAVILPKSPHVRSLKIALVMTPHHLLHSRRSLGSMIEWDSRDMVMHNVRLDRTVKEDSANEAKVSVHS